MIAFIIDDARAQFQLTLERHDLYTISLHSKRLCTTNSADNSIAQLRLAKPSLSIIKLSGPVAELGSKLDWRRFWNLTRLAQEQLVHDGT